MDKPEKKIRAPMKKTTRVLIVLLTIYALLGLTAAAVLIDARHVHFYMLGSQEINVEYGSEFADPGCRAVSTGRLFGDGGRPLAVRAEGAVDSHTLGDYTIRYRTRYFFVPQYTERLVHVVDTTPPSITLKSREDYAPSWFTGYEEEGYSAYDLHDGDLTAAVERHEEAGLIEYRVSDASGNTASVIRKLPYTLGRPVITLQGEAEMTLPAAFDYIDPGYSAADTDGRDMSEYIQVEGEIIPWLPGEYSVRYYIENGRGETVEAARQITVTAAARPETVLPETPTIYLTFDDGPGPYTERLLNVLAAHDVKATFFVTCLNPDYADMIGRAYAEGHSIGIHTATHNYYEIYDSEQAYFADFQRAQEMVRQQTGTTTQLFRFPGGSSNTVSRINPGIMTRLAAAMEDMGYVYFDWNVSSGDAGETTDTDKVYENITDGCYGRNVSIVLQHDIKDYSVAAVERVILWGLSHGYTFAPLTEQSPTAHHTIAN